MTQTTGTFDFTQINEATKNLTTGMKLAIAQGLLTQSINSLTKFENTLANDAHTLGEELRLFRIRYKESGQIARMAQATESQVQD
jgi:hypothetical protein